MLFRSAWVFWLDIVRRRLNDPTFVRPFPLLRVRGVITSKVPVVQDMFRIGVPVWHIRSIEQFTTGTLVTRVEPSFVNPSIYFSTSRTIVSGGKVVHAPRWSSGPTVQYLSTAEVQRLARKFSLSSNPIFGSAMTFDPAIVFGDMAVQHSGIEADTAGAPSGMYYNTCLFIR